MLLNPHGSDETTLLVFQLLQRLPDFLTHTVQMKQKSFKNLAHGGASFLTHTVQMKPEIKVIKHKNYLLLNPHGSDETYLES